MHAAARELPGFLEAETFEPVAGIQDRWALVFRLDGQAGVAAWLKSEQRTTRLEQAGAFSPSEQITTEAGSIKKTVTVLVETSVKPADVEAFKAWQAHRFDDQPVTTTCAGWRHLGHSSGSTAQQYLSPFLMIC